ncbi:MAG: YihY/virulence factor BrkB family protein [Armatimonadota bacterium]|nr:YihY/virulence factor BrkB family protein [bacterium]
MSLRDRMKGILDLGKTVIREYSADNGTLMAAAISYFIFLSLIPLLLLAIAVVGLLLGSPANAERLIVGQFGQYAATPGTRGIIEQVVRGSSAATGIGIIAFLWSGTSVIVILEMVLNQAWEVNQKRGFVAQRLLAIGVLIVLGALFGLSFGLTTAITAIRSLDVPIPGGLSWIWDLLGYLIPPIITILTFTLLYKVLPNTRVPWRSALIGGIFAGILWEIAKIGFSFYVTNIANYSRVYGSLAGVILLLLWIYYSSIITILGAELSSVKVGRVSEQR